MRSFGILPASVDKLPVKSDLPLLVVPEREFLSDSYTSGSAHEQSLVRLAVAPFDSVSQGVDISCWHHKSFFPSITQSEAPLLSPAITGSLQAIASSRIRARGQVYTYRKMLAPLRHGLILNRARLARARCCV